MAVLHSRHGSVSITVAGEVHHVTFPATIGDGAGETPRAVADKLVKLGAGTRDYWIEGEDDQQPNPTAHPVGPDAVGDAGAELAGGAPAESDKPQGRRQRNRGGRHDSDD